MIRGTLQAWRETLGNQHSDTLSSIGNLGMLMKAQGDLAGAAPLLREALQARRGTPGNRHPHTLFSIRALGLLLRNQGETVEALALLRELQTSLGRADPQMPSDALRELETLASAGGRGGGGGDSVVSTWKKGMRVRLEGLKARADLNGLEGVLLGGVAENWRAPVKLVSSGVHSGTELMVKPANLRRVA